MERLFLRRAFQVRAPLLRQSATAATTAPSRHQSATYSTESANEQKETRRVVFSDDVNPQLAPILKHVQDNVILPSFLPSRKQERIFNAKHVVSLKNDPVILEIDDITHRFSHIPISEIPSNTRSLLGAVNAMETREDWDQLNRLLVGLRRAGRVISTRHWLAFIRVAAQKGKLGLVYEAARQSKFTGLKLDLPATLHELLYFTQLRAMESGWSKKTTEQSLNWTRMAFDMTARNTHKVDERKRPEWFDWPLVRDPLALASIVHLAAAWDLGHDGGKDNKGDVAFWAKQLVDVWPPQKGLLEMYPEGAYERNTRGSLLDLRIPPYYIPKASLALHGLRLAERVSQPVLATQLKGIADALDAELKEKIGGLERGLEPQSQAYKTYYQLFDESGNVKFEVTAEPEPEPAREPEAAETEAGADEIVAEEPKEESK